MISNKIQTLFTFIAFLDSHKEQFKKHKPSLDEVTSIWGERATLFPCNNYRDRLRVNALKTKWEREHSIINKEIITPINQEMERLKLCSPTEPFGYYWNGIEIETYRLQENLEEQDIKHVIQAKNQYIEFRQLFNYTHLMSSFFKELDEITKPLFDFFNDSDSNEYRDFERQTKIVTSIEEATEELMRGGGSTIEIHSTKNQRLTQTKPTDLPRQNPDNNTREEQSKTDLKTTTIHHVLSYVFETMMKGEQIPVGKKKVLESIGNKRLGIGRGNTFYKKVNNVLSKEVDLNSFKDLVVLGGDDWAELVIALSDTPNETKAYLTKQKLIN